MTLESMKKRIYQLIEEVSDSQEHLTDDPDYEKKVNACIDMIQNELSRIKKIPAKMEYSTIEPEEGEETTGGHILEFPSDMYQLDKIIGCDFDLYGKEIHFDPEYNGDVTIYYYKYPTAITDSTADTYTFELDQDALEIMPFGVAGDMLKSDPSTSYGSIYSNRYNELKQYLDSRYTNGSIFIDTSEAID